MDYKLILGVLLFVLLFAALIIGLVWILVEPTCYDFAQAFTGKYYNNPVAGCFIQLSDGKYYYYKNIIIQSGK